MLPRKIWAAQKNIKAQDMAVLANALGFFVSLFAVIPSALFADACPGSSLPFGALPRPLAGQMSSIGVVRGSFGRFSTLVCYTAGCFS